MNKEFMMILTQRTKNVNSFFKKSCFFSERSGKILNFLFSKSQNSPFFPQMSILRPSPRSAGNAQATPPTEARSPSPTAFAAAKWAHFSQGDLPFGFFPINIRARMRDQNTVMSLPSSAARPTRSAAAAVALSSGSPSVRRGSRARYSCPLAVISRKSFSPP